MRIPGLREQYVTVNGCQIRYFTGGPESAPPIVLLHGGGIDSAVISWRHLASELVSQ